MAQSTGIRTRHSRTCNTRTGGGCNCEPTYEAFVYSRRDGRKIRRSFSGKGAFAAAKGWRTDALKQVKDKRLRAPSPRTLRQEADEWLAGAREGRIMNKRERPYKPAVLRNYETALRLRVLPELGDRKLADIDLADLLALKEDLSGDGHSPSTIRNSFVPLQAIFRRARRHGLIPVNPTADLQLPTAASRDRAATPRQASELLGPLSGREGALFATAFYAGLRRGELRALRVGDVDLAEAVISVERGWDSKEGPIEPKSRAGTRRVFVLDALRPYLEPLVDGRPCEDLVFGHDSAAPFEPRGVDRKVSRAWNAADKARAEEAEKQGQESPEPLTRFTLHEARHSFSTWLDHAGVSERRADRYMGHAGRSVADDYRHELPGQRAEDRQRLDAYLAGAADGKVVPLAVAN
jgi:integrase